MENQPLDDILGIENSESQNNQNQINIKSSQDKYPALRIISGILKVIGWIIAIASIIATFYFLSEEDGLQFFSIASILGGGILTLGFLSMSEIIKVFIDIEENTRKMSEK